VKLNCGVKVFVDNNIPEEWAKVLLGDLIDRVGKRDFEMDLKTECIFKNPVPSKETGKIRVKYIRANYEHEDITKNAAVCLSFLFFTNALRTMGWIPTPRRGEHWDYWCLDEEGNKIVIEVGGSTQKYGARKDQQVKKKRFASGPPRIEPTFISSVGFQEGNHLVCRYC